MASMDVPAGRPVAVPAAKVVAAKATRPASVATDSDVVDA